MIINKKKLSPWLLTLFVFGAYGKSICLENTEYGKIACPISTFGGKWVYNFTSPDWEVFLIPVTALSNGISLKSDKCYFDERLDFDFKPTKILDEICKKWYEIRFFIDNKTEKLFIVINGFHCVYLPTYFRDCKYPQNLKLFYINTSESLFEYCDKSIIESLTNLDFDTCKSLYGDKDREKKKTLVRSIPEKKEESFSDDVQNIIAFVITVFCLVSYLLRCIFCIECKSDRETISTASSISSLSPSYSEAEIASLPPNHSIIVKKEKEILM